MAAKGGTVIRVGTPGYEAARELYDKVVAKGWDAIGVKPAQAPKRLTLGAVAAVVLQRTRDRLK